MPEKISAGGLRNSLRGIFNRRLRGAEESSLMPAESLAVPPVVPLAGEASVASVTPAPEAEQTVTPGPTVTEAPPAQEQAPAGELPDWLSAPTAEPVPAPEPALLQLWKRQVVEEPAVEVPVAPSVELSASTGTAAEAEKSPEQLAIEQFEEALIAADEALGRLRAGETLDNNQLREAMAAAATANGLIRNLPERYLKVLLASRRVGENREYNRLNFQKDILAAIRVFSQANKG